MERDFAKLMLSKSEKELQEYIDDRLKYTPSAVFAAIDELKNRGKFFSDGEIETIKIDLEKKQEVDKERFTDDRTTWKRNIVTDADAPQYYSVGAIYGFSIFFSTIFGAVLMAINLRKTESKKGVAEVIIFGVAYFSLQIYILSFIPRNTGLNTVFGIAGAAVINHFFWRKYIGSETKYRKKPIWVPLIISISITAVILAAMIYTDQI